jgi:hypothetical protein
VSAKKIKRKKEKKEEFKSIFDSFDVEWMEIVRNISSRWLSLSSAVDK